MAKTRNNSLEEYMLVTLGTEGLNNESVTELSKADSHFNEILKGMKSGAQGNIISNDTKTIDPAKHTWKRSVLVPLSDYNSVIYSGQETSAKIYGREGVELPINTNTNLGGHFTNTSPKEMLMLPFKRKRLGSLARLLAEEEVSRFLGTFEKTNSDFYKIGYPVAKKDWEEQLDSLGGDTPENRKKAFSYFGKQMDSQMKSSAYYSKEITEKNRASQKAKEEEKQRKEEEKKRKDEEKNSAGNKIKNFLTLTKILAIITTIADIVRRILTATFERAKEVTRDSSEAIKTGVNPFIAQKYKRMERAVGLDEGTMLNASGTILHAFGQIDQLDPSAMKLIAPVITSKVRTAIETGQGKANPDEVAKMIINDFYNKAMQGVDWSGSYVGREKAFLNLTDRLSRFSPEMANVLATMHYLNTSEMYEGKINSFDDLINLQGEQSSWNINRKIMENLGIELEGLTAKLKALKENVFDRLGASLATIIDWVNNIDLFMSEDDKVYRNEKNRKLNLEAQESMKSQKEDNAKAFALYLKNQGISLETAEKVFKTPIWSTSTGVTEEQYNQIKTFQAMQEVLDSKLEQAKKANEKDKVNYSASSYTKASVIKSTVDKVMFYKASADEIREVYERMYGNINLESLLDADNNKLYIDKIKEYLPESEYKVLRGNKLKKVKTKNLTVDDLKYLAQKGILTQDMADKALNEVILLTQDKLISQNIGREWETEPKIGLPSANFKQSVISAQDIAKARQVEKLYLQDALAEFLRSSIAQEYVKEGKGKFTVTGSYYDKADRKIVLKLDVGGKEKTVGILDTSSGDFHLTNGNIDTVEITQADINYANASN